jgi:hypothetical protein
MPLPVVDLDDLAVVAPVARVGHDPRCRGINRRHITGVEVEPAMKRGLSVKRIVTRTETAADLIMFERRRQR